MRIGEFSQLSQLTVRMLRHYDAIGLLTPADIDEQTGYRRYEAGQLRTAHRIAALKALGLSLDQIRQLLADEVSSNELVGMLRIELARSRDARDEMQRRIDDLERRLEETSAKGWLDEVDLVERAQPAIPWLALDERVTDLPAAMELAGEVVGAVVRAGLQGPMVVAARADSFLDADLPLSMGICTDRDDPIDLGDGRRLEPTVLPAVPRLVAAVHDGPYDVGHRRCHLAIADWLDRHDLALAGETREVFPDATLVLGDAGILEIQYSVVSRSTILT